MRVAYTDEANADFVEFGRYIARDDPMSARRFLQELKDFIGRIAETPRGYRIRTEWGGAVRAARYGIYLVVFEIDAEELLILRIASGRRNIARLLAAKQL